MVDRSKIIPECRRYYAEVGLIITEFAEEDGPTMVRAVLDRLSQRTPSVQTLSADTEFPDYVALEIVSTKFIDYTLVEEVTWPYSQVKNTPEWQEKVLAFEKEHLSDYGPVEPAEGDELRIYIVVRRDIGDVLSKPKFGVQCAHATLSVWGICVQKDPDKAYRYFPCNTDKIDTGQAKIVLQVKDGAELLALADKARELGFPVATIIDAARTELPQPTLTAIAIGPLWYKSEGRFLRRYRLYDDKVERLPPPPREEQFIYTVEKGA